jgi:hypothetical protein
MSEPREWRKGEHRVHFEPPDVLWMKYRGFVNLEEAKWIVGFCQEIEQRQTFIVVADVSDNMSFDPEARRYVSEHFLSEHLVAVIYIGARLIHKAAAKGISLVHKVLLGREVTPVYFVANEAEARYTLAQLRSSEHQPSP